MAQPAADTDVPSTREPLDLGWTRHLSCRRVKVPTVLQLEAVECGAACLAMVLAHYGRWVTLEELRQACAVTRNGAQALDLVHAARRYGLQAQGHRYELDELHDAPLPLIAFWDFAHFLVIEGVSSRGVFVNDPGSGRRLVSWDEADRSFTGLTIQTTPRPGFQTGGEPPHLLRNVFGWLSGSWHAVVFAILLGVSLAVLGLTIPLLSLFFVDDVLGGVAPDGYWTLAAILVPVTICQAAVTLAQRHIINLLFLKQSTVMADTTFTRLLRLPYPFFTARSSGDLAFRMQLTRSAADVMTTQLAPALLAAVTTIIYVVILALIWWPLAIPTVLALAVNFGVVFAVQRSRIERNRRATTEETRLQAFAVYGLKSIRTVKSSGGESVLFGQVTGLGARAANATQDLQAPAAALSGLPAAVATFASLLMLIGGALLIMAGDLTPGMLIAALALLGSALAPVATVVGVMTGIQELPGSLDRIADIDHQEPDPELVDRPGPGTALSADLGIELRDVTFGYESEHPIVADLTLTIPAGTSLAIVGSSGCGKSTVARLVTGLLQPWSGQVVIGGVDRRQADRSQLVDAVGVVDQRVVLFEGSVRENLTLWDDSISTDELQHACDDAVVSDVIAGRMGNLDAPVIEAGRNFSGGERQRLEIARALARKPRLLVMDEATSAVDPAVEQAIMANIRGRGCTSVIVAHRLSTVRTCDQIIVLDAGRIAERGSHDELIAANGRYAALVRDGDPEGVGLR